MKALLQRLPSWLVDVIALIAGAFVTLSLAPFNIWPLGMVAPLVLYLCLQCSSPSRGFLRALLFGLAMFGSGTSWVYVSIHDFGYTAAPLAMVLTAIFVIGLALVFSFPFWIYARFFNQRTASALAFCCLWVLGEWLRSWFLTGFPWLYLGYAHISTWLSGWAPVFGVFGLSLFTVITPIISVESLNKIIAQRTASTTALGPLAVVITIWIVGFFLTVSLNQSDLRQDDARKKISVAIVQPNIPLEIKWNPLYRSEIMQTLREFTKAQLDKDLIVWPEAAVPLLYHDAENFLDEIHDRAEASETGIITGILYSDQASQKYYNSIIGLGRASGNYFKQRLVPFGEYVPLEEWLRGLIAFFDLPNSVIHKGPKNQEILEFDDFKVAPSICYEIVYPDLVAELSRDAGLLITISNDAWFGNSIGPIQHFQMAQMRALENRRYVIRATNTGISGIINSEGKVTLLGQRFNRESIESLDVAIGNQKSLFSLWGSKPVVLSLFIIMTIIALRNLRARQRRVMSLPY